MIGEVPGPGPAFAMGPNDACHAGVPSAVNAKNPSDSNEAYTIFPSAATLADA